MASIMTTGYTTSRGRFCQATMSSTMASVIRLIVSRDTSVPYISARCAWMSPVVRPLAYSEITLPARPSRRR